MKQVGVSVLRARIHAAAGLIGFLTIAAFWTSTLSSELFASHATIAATKAAILKGMFFPAPAMAIVGTSGLSLVGRRSDRLSQAKKRRMPITAANGLLILLRAAFFLASKAAAGSCDTILYAVQLVDLMAGAVNLTKMGPDVRDGL